MDILSILYLLGGVGLFLFGMSFMGSSLEKLAGGSLAKTLEKLTTSKNKAVGNVKGWGLGTLVTGIIQSSAATTIMLIGFVNAGIMGLGQSLPVVYGANVGSTVTAQILRLGDLASGSLVLQLLKPSSFAPMLACVGAFIYLFTKKSKVKNISGIFIGLGILFYGMTAMEEVFLPLRESAKFQSFFTSFENPLIGILTGLLITALIQSSSASVGILQALSATGTIKFSTAFPIIIGQNLGKCMTIILGSIGAGKKAKRVALSYLLFNIFGALMFVLVIYGIQYTVGLPFFENVVNRGNIANIHLGFNLITSLVLLPFTNAMEKLTGKIIGEDEESEDDKEFKKLDDMILQTPTIALRESSNLIHSMIGRINENFEISTGLIDKYDENKFEQLLQNESFIDRCETVLSAYIVRIDRKRLSRDQRLVVSEILNSISDFERMGDYSINIAYVAKEMHEQGVSFSDVGKYEVNTMIDATKYAVTTLEKAFLEVDEKMAMRVEPLSDTIERLTAIIKAHHVDRLQDGRCSVEKGVALFDLITCFERISAHATNVSLHVLKRIRGASDFDEMHGHSDDRSGVEYQSLINYYENQFIIPVTNPPAVLPTVEDVVTDVAEDDGTSMVSKVETAILKRSDRKAKKESDKDKEKAKVKAKEKLKEKKEKNKNKDKKNK